YLGRGEEFYRRAAEEIVAAKAADPTVTNATIGERFGRSDWWVRQLVEWALRARGTSTPWEGEQTTEERNTKGARKVLREAPLEQVERIIDELPPERQSAIAAAAGSAYHGARQEYEREERDRTPAERSERRAAADLITEPVRKAQAPFQTLGIVAHIEQA